MCDDIRQEINGKRTFVGVYNPKVLVPSFPASLAFHLVLVVSFESKGEGPFSLRITSEGTEKPMEFKGHIVISELISGEIFTIGPLLMQFEKPSEFSLEAEMPGGWQRIQTWRVEIQPSGGR